jgi:hypothetical protein
MGLDRGRACALWRAVRGRLLCIELAQGDAASRSQFCRSLCINLVGGRPGVLTLAAQLAKRYEMCGILFLIFLLGALQAVLVAALGFALKRLFDWAIKRFAHVYTPRRAA